MIVKKGAEIDSTTEKDSNIQMYHAFDFREILFIEKAIFQKNMFKAESVRIKLKNSRLISSPGTVFSSFS
jgi:hypothetical protein